MRTHAPGVNGSTGGVPLDTRTHAAQGTPGTSSRPFPADSFRAWIAFGSEP